MIALRISPLCSRRNAGSSRTGGLQRDLPSGTSRATLGPERPTEGMAPQSRTIQSHMARCVNAAAAIELFDESYRDWDSVRRATSLCACMLFGEDRLLTKARSRRCSDRCSEGRGKARKLAVREAGRYSVASGGFPLLTHRAARGSDRVPPHDEPGASTRSPRS